MALGSYALGLIFIVLVAIVWASSSVLTQYLYNGQSFDSPFLLTYIGVSLFSVWLPIKLVTEWFRQHLGVDVKPNHYAPPSCEMEPTNNNIISGNNEQQQQQQYQAHYLSDTSEGSTRSPKPWTKEDHMRAALKIAPVWFVANWAYNSSLAYTSITSSTVLASTGSLFTFTFAVLMKDERFTWMKFSGVVLGVLGSCLTTLQDVDEEDGGGDGDSEVVEQTRRYLLLKCAEGGHCAGRLLLGDLLGLTSAIGYGAYAVQTRILCPRSEDLYSMQVLLGYIGLINMILLSPVAIYQLLSVDTGLTWLVLGFIVVKGLFDNVLSDYLWLRAVVLTNATIATVGLGLTIPLAFGSDVLLGKSHVFTTGSILGALSVLAGFILVNVGHEEDDDMVASTDDNDPLRSISGEEQSTTNRPGIVTIEQHTRETII